MNRTIALIKISNIKRTASEVKSNINKTQVELIEYIRDLKRSREKIINEIADEYIINNFLDRLNGVINKMVTSLSQSKEILDKLSIDATNEIKDIVDAYNSSIDPKHPETPLQYETVSLTSISGIDSITN